MFVGVPWNPRGITTDAPEGIRKRYITRAPVQTHGATDGCPACQSDGQVHVPRCRKRFEDIFVQEKEPGQPREVVQQDGPDLMAVQVVSGDQRVQMEQEPQQQHASVPEPSAQPSSSSYEEPMQVSTTPRRARNPDDESEMRTVRPRLDMNATINELCERDFLELDWEKLAMDNSSVFYIYIGLKLDEEQVRAGRETEVKRMLEFEVYEEVNEQEARGKRIWNSADWWSIKSEVRASAKTCLRPHHHLQQCVSFSPVLHRVVMAVASACGMCRWHSSTHRLRKKCLFDRQTCERTRPSGDSGKSCTGHRLQVHVGRGWCEKHCVTVTGKFSHAYRVWHTMRLRTHW